MDKRIVCNCHDITAQIILDFVAENPDKTLDEIIEEFEIGTACGRCLKPDCDDRIDIHIAELIKK